MLILPLEEARAGMKLAAPVAHPDNPDQDLLRQGYVLEDAVIERMRSLEIGFIYVDYPGLDSLDKHIAVYLSPARQQIYKQIKGAIADVQKQTRPGVPYHAYCDTTRELLTTLMGQGHNPVYLDQMSRQGADAVGHAAAVAHLSLLLGLKLESYVVEQRSRLPSNRAKDIVGLGVAGMLHDIGLAKLPEHLQKVCEVEPPEDAKDYEEWKSHAQIGYELIRNDCDATSAACVLQHHQHFDGSGFPQMMLSLDGSRGALEGRRIHIFSRIIFCANLYDRLSAPLGRHGRRSNIEVHRLFATRYAGWYDPEIFRVLQNVAPPYPPGSKLRLTDGSRVVVTDVNTNAPFKPVVRRLGEDNWTLVGDAIDLRTPGAPGIAADERMASAAAA